MNQKKLFFVLLIFLILFSCARVRVSEEMKAKDFEAFMSNGIQKLTEKDYDSAIVSFKKAVSLRPNSEKAHNFLGIAYFMKKSYKNAEDEFSKSISINSKYPPPYSNLGNVYLKLNKLDKAEKYYKKAIDLAPESPSSYYSLGNLLLSLGRFEEGMAYLLKGFQIDPDFMDRDTTLKTELSQLSSKGGELYFTYAKLFASAGNIERTIEYLERAKKAGFKDWERILKEKEFEKVRENPEIKKFLQ
ncbi:MAG: tetratricopeptide repeat protein [Candidatus Aminicenantia bacterium]